MADNYRGRIVPIGDRAGVSGGTADRHHAGQSAPAHRASTDKYEFEMILGWNAACRGEPLDPYQSQAFHEGYLLWQTRPTKKIGLASNDELEDLADQLCSRRQSVNS